MLVPLNHGVLRKIISVVVAHAMLGLFVGLPAYFTLSWIYSSDESFTINLETEN